MAYYKPLQKTNGKWYYTCSNSAGTFDVECCCQYMSCPDCIEYFMSDNRILYDGCKTCDGKHIVDKPNACQGHDTPEEAIEHYRLHNISNAKTGFNEDEQHKCEICECWTQTYMYFVDFFKSPVYLCQKHLTHESLGEATSPKKEIKFSNQYIQKAEQPKYSGYIPNNFDEAVDYLVKQKTNVDDHYGAGMSTRNNWGLWGNSTAIAKWFTAKRLYHGDDRSGILAKAVNAKIKNEEFDLEKEIKFYQEWWCKKYGEKFSLENMEKEFFENNEKE